MNKLELDEMIEKARKDSYASLGAVIGDAPLETQIKYANESFESAEKVRVMSREYLEEWEKKAEL